VEVTHGVFERSPGGSGMIVQLLELEKLLNVELKRSKPKKKAVQSFLELPHFLVDLGAEFKSHTTFDFKDGCPQFEFQYLGCTKFLRGGQAWGFTRGWELATEEPLYFVIIYYGMQPFFIFFSNDPTEEAKEQYARS
jgi:hypothetical protein